MSLQAIKQRFGIIGNAPALENALNTAVRVAPTDLTVLITGESGVGKEVFSKIIHELSSRKHGQFIAINCGAIPEGTINSELFGHEKGAFTGASEARKGYFETTDGGTIFLDEIGEMPLDTQTHLLRVLENGEFMRVGSSKVLKTNVRVIAATNVGLLDSVERRKFREDLYYRLSTVPIRVPALRERKEDISLLFRKFAIDFSEKYREPSVQLDAEAKMLLENYEFPGNIRQLKNLAEQISALASQKLIDAPELLTFLPKEAFKNRGLAAARSNEPMSEREILYKLLFDLKQDMNDLKNWVGQLVKVNNLQMPSGLPSNAPQIGFNSSFNQPQANANNFNNNFENNFGNANFKNDGFNGSFNNDNNDYETHYEAHDDDDIPIYNADNQPIIISSKPKTEPEIEDLNIEALEKMAIKRALKKHKNRRKEAATELGMSERTLYRKIKQYDIEA